ncbi:MAG: gliding motility-associated C-terminal domain-containing protein [Flavobacteriia bacterium]|nr:gliding motility-associated C-terminal domain-containing protein [Flavobacteriia bacterium]
MFDYLRRILGCILLFSSNFLIAQYDTIHYIPPVAYSYINNQTEIVFSTNSTIPVTVSVYKSNNVFLFDTIVVKDIPVRHVLENTNPSGELLTNNSTLLSEGLKISGAIPFAVNVRNIGNDTYFPSFTGNYSLTSKGKKALGTKFHLIGYRVTNLVYGILAIEDNTTITISNNTNQTINLNAGESYLINSITLGNNIGTAVVSNKNISLTSSTNSESPAGCHDPIADQLIPDTLAGKEYLIVKGHGNSTLEQFTIVAIYDSTYYNINGGPNVLLVNAGDFNTISNGVNINDYKFLSASKNVLVAQGSGISCEAGQTILPPLSCTGSKIIQTKDYLGLSYDVYVIAHPISTPTLNGIPLLNPIIINADWNLYIFNQSLVPIGEPILLQSSTYMHCGILQRSGGYSMFDYFSGFENTNKIEIQLSTSNNTNELIEGCEHAQIVITRDDATSEDVFLITTIGTAVSGEDYESLISSDTLIQNQYSDTLYLNTLYNEYLENDETIHLLISYIDHCSGLPYIYDTVIMIKNYYPMIHNDLDSINVCDETEIDFGLSTVVSQGVPSYHYFWVNNLDSTFFTSDFTSKLKPNENLYHLTVIDSCMHVMDVFFNVYNQCPISVPNVITANNDEINDFFIIKNLEDYNQIKLMILNRWGNVVYENEYYDNSFNGKNNNNRKLPADVYFYKIEIISNKYSYSSLDGNILYGNLTVFE